MIREDRREGIGGIDGMDGIRGAAVTMVGAAGKAAKQAFRVEVGYAVRRPRDRFGGIKDFVGLTGFGGSHGGLLFNSSAALDFFEHFDAVGKVDPVVVDVAVDVVG